MQGPGLMASAGGDRAAAGDAEQHPAGGQEVLECRDIGGSDRRSDTDSKTAGGRARAGPAAAGQVGDLAAAAAQPHRRPEVRQAVGSGSRGDDHAQAGRVEGEEPDTGPPRVVADVGAHVRFAEVRYPGHPLAAWRSHTHVERHEADPRRAAERLDLQAAGHQSLHIRGLERPVQERQPFPPLPHDRPVNGERAGPQSPRSMRGHALSLRSHKFSRSSGITAVVRGKPPGREAHPGALTAGLSESRLGCGTVPLIWAPSSASVRSVRP